MLPSWAIRPPQISALVSESSLPMLALDAYHGDGGALFNNTAVTAATGHANLLVAGLGTDYTAWNAVALAMWNQPLLIKHTAGYYGTGAKMPFGRSIVSCQAH